LSKKKTTNSSYEEVDYRFSFGGSDAFGMLNVHVRNVYEERISKEDITRNKNLKPR
jgi:hypothetical protein